MTRQRKALGLAVLGLLAVLASSALLISGAAAEESNLPHFTAFNKATSKHENAVLKGTIEEGPQELRSLTKTYCHHVEYEATITGGLSETLTVTPKFFGTKANTTSPECETEGATEFWKTTVEMNGCDFSYPLTTDLGGGKYTSRPDILCPPKQEIDIKITKPTGVCTVRVPEQKNLGHTLIYNRTTGDGREDLTIENELQGISYSTSPAAICGVPDKTWTNGEYKGKVTLTAENEAKPAEPMNVTIKDVVTP